MNSKINISDNFIFNRRQINCSRNILSRRIQLYAIQNIKRINLTIVTNRTTSNGIVLARYYSTLLSRIVGFNTNTGSLQHPLHELSHYIWCPMGSPQIINPITQPVRFKKFTKRFLTIFEGIRPCTEIRIRSYVPSRIIFSRSAIFRVAAWI